MSKWKRIKTAPKNGTPILLRLESGDAVVGRFVSGVWQVSLSAITDVLAFSVMTMAEPTHWCPLPPPPLTAR